MTAVCPSPSRRAGQARDEIRRCLPPLGRLGTAMAGGGGAAAAMLGFFGPTAGLGTALALGWGRLRDGRWSEAVRAALIPFGAGVALAGLLVLARISVQSWVGAAIALVSFGLLQRTRLNAAVVVLAAAGLGAWLGL